MAIATRKRRKNAAAPQILSDEPELHSALLREVEEWDKRHISDKGHGARVSEIGSGILDGTLPIEQAYGFRKLLFAELIGIGVEANAIQHRLALSPNDFQTLRTDIFRTHVTDDERTILRNIILAGIHADREKIEATILEVEMSDLTIVAKANLRLKLIEAKQSLRDSEIKLGGLSMPQQIEVKHQTTYSVVLLTEDAPPQAIEATSTVFEVPALPAPEENETPFPVFP